MIKFKRKKKMLPQWGKMSVKNKALYRIMLDIAKICKELWGKDIVLTEVYRSDKLHRARLKRIGHRYYGTVHSYWRGIDFRDWWMKPWQKQILALYINNTYTYDKKRPKKKTLLFHNIGLGSHGHVQNVK